MPALPYPSVGIRSVTSQEGTAERSLTCGSGMSMVPHVSDGKQLQRNSFPTLADRALSPFPCRPAPGPQANRRRDAAFPSLSRRHYLRLRATADSPPWRRPRPWWRCCAGATPPLPACFLTGSSPPLPLRRSPRPHWSRSPCQACSRETDAAAASPLRSSPTHASDFLGDTMRMLWLPGQRTKLLRGRREIPE